MGKILDIASEPVNETYGRLVDLAAQLCRTFSLVWRDQIVFAASAVDVATELASVLVREERTDRWPGTVLSDTLATVRHYRFTRESSALLKRPAGLYAWRAPGLPEDVAFYLADSTAWLTSISHEREAWFDLAQNGAVEIQRLVPGLTIRPRAT